MDLVPGISAKSASRAQKWCLGARLVALLLPICSAVCRQTGMRSGALGPKYTSTGPRSHLGRHIPALGPLLHDSRNPFSNFALISAVCDCYEA